MAVFIGLDIGGTKFMAAAADGQGNLLRKPQREDTPVDLQAGIALLNTMIRNAAGGEEILAIGAAIGGPLDYKTGVVSPLHQPQWRQVPLKEMMEKQWQCPFFVDVDTNAAALGEYAADPQKPERFLYITISTGMGGGFLLDGKLYRGMHDGHPEIAHQSIAYHCNNPAGIQCECGVPDCLEALVSGNGIRRVYGRPAENLSESEWEEVTYNIAQGLRNLNVIYLPDVIVLGGGVAVGRGNRLVEDLQRRLREWVKIIPVSEVRLSHYGYESTLHGAVTLAIHGME